MANTRLKDYFDLFILAGENILEPTEIASAIAATFRRRATQLPPMIPLGLTRAYSTKSERSAQCEVFLNTNRLEAPSLAMVVETINTHLGDPLRRSFRTSKKTLNSDGRSANAEGKHSESAGPNSRSFAMLLQPWTQKRLCFPVHVRPDIRY